MKRIIIITVILLVACGYITVAYFKNLNPPGQHTTQVMRNIPDNAALIFEFSNDRTFYDIFKGNKLLAAVSGQDNLHQLDTLRKIFNSPGMPGGFFNGQNIFVSAHPADTGMALLLTAVAKKGLNANTFAQIKSNSHVVVTPYTAGKRKGYTLYLKSIKKRFYIISKGRNIFSGSFSQQLIQAAAGYEREKPLYTLLSAQQNSNSLANLYVNYHYFQPLLKSYFSNSAYLPADVYGLAANAVLSLNYKSDALMFNGVSTIIPGAKHSYLNVFIGQQAVENHLKNVLPSTTAYYSGFALSNPKQFFTDLDKWQQNTGVAKKEAGLYATIKNETGVNIKPVFNSLMSNEFAIVNTRFQEKLGIVALKDGSKLLPHFMNLSSGMSDNSGKLNYDRLLYYLLGDAFSDFRKPFFMIIDNYLIVANSYKEIESYYESYMNRKFLSKSEGYSNFNNLMSQRSTVCYFVNFKNTKPVFKRGMRKDIYKSFSDDTPGWQDVYGASYQFTAADNNFYTNFCIGLNTETETEQSIAQN